MLTEVRLQHSPGPRQTGETIGSAMGRPLQTVASMFSWHEFDCPVRYVLFQSGFTQLTGLRKQRHS